MLCCLLGALLAGNVVAAWRFALAAARRGAPALASRAMLAGVVAISLIAATASLAGHPDHEGGAAFADAAPCAGGERTAP